MSKLIFCLQFVCLFVSLQFFFLFLQGDGQLMKAVENELNKSIKRHLESGEFPVKSNFASCNQVLSFEFVDKIVSQVWPTKRINVIY